MGGLGSMMEEFVEKVGFESCQCILCINVITVQLFLRLMKHRETSGKDGYNALVLFLHTAARVKVDDVYSYDWMCNVQIRLQFISTMYR